MVSTSTMVAVSSTTVVAVTSTVVVATTESISVGVPVTVTVWVTVLVGWSAPLARTHQGYTNVSAVVTVVKKYDEQSAVPDRVGNAEALMARKPFPRSAHTFTHEKGGPGHIQLSALHFSAVARPSTEEKTSNAHDFILQNGVNKSCQSSLLVQRRRSIGAGVVCLID